MERKKAHKNRKKKIIVICVLVSVIFFTSVFARYMLNKYNDFYSRTKEFYFNSDKLGENSPIYQIENWPGLDEYTITINMNSNKNNLLSTSYDIGYDISYTCSDNVICNLSKASGVIYSSTNKDYFTLRIVPNTALKTGDKVTVQIAARAKSPYQKTLNAKFNLMVGQEKISYEIIDSPGNPYLELSISNTLSYFTVNGAFDSYNVGDKITRDIYKGLSEENKQKCSSAVIKLSFDPNDILLDMTNNNYLNATNVTNTTKDSYNFINGITFKVDAITSTKIRFYKIDATKNYTYPIQNNSPIISVVTL